MRQLQVEPYLEARSSARRICHEASLDEAFRGLISLVTTWLGVEMEDEDEDLGHFVYSSFPHQLILIFLLPVRFLPIPVRSFGQIGYCFVAISHELLKTFTAAYIPTGI